MRKFVGRHDYLKILHDIWSSGKTKLIAVYGRRRIGKTALINVFSRGKRAFIFEALEGEETAAQVRHFLDQLSQFAGKPYIRDLNYKDWFQAFNFFSQLIKEEQEIIICFDELSWMASGHTKLISIIKYFWDRDWKNHPHLLFILCGSVAFWMLKNVVRSKALYGRVSESLLIEPLKPFEVAEFIGGKRGRQEILEYLVCFGGVPRYLEEFDFNQSLQLNIERTCFHPAGFFKEEAEKIFYNQFKETSTYRKIVKLLMKAPLFPEELSRRIRMPSGGGFKLYLDNLAAAGIIGSLEKIHHFKPGKTSCCYISDEFLRFHAQFIHPYMREIEELKSTNKFEKITSQRWYPFLGYAFERFCLKHRYLIADLLGFGRKIIACGTVFEKERGGVQLDLVFIRNDNVITICEVKYLSEAPSTGLIREFEAKLSRCALPKGITIERALITNREPSQPLVESGYFHHIFRAETLLKESKS